jgi:hypothetical protein
MSSLYAHYRRFLTKLNPTMAKTASMEDGRYINSFNQMVIAANNTNLPVGIEELNKLLPVIKPNRDEISKPSSNIDPGFEVERKRYRPSALTVDRSTGGTRSNSYFT